MRIKGLAAVAAAGLVGGALALAGPASATQADAKLSLTLSGDCEAVTVTFVNNSNFAFFGDIRVDDEPGTSDQWSAAQIGQGLLAGELFGDRYQPVDLPAGEITTVQLGLAAGTGERTVAAVVRRGPEQHWYVPWESLTVDCGEPDDEPADPEEEPECVDVNTADAATLQLLRHVGEDRAAQIIALRPFSSVDDLDRVNGLAAGGPRLAELAAGGDGYPPLCEIVPDENGTGGEQAADNLPVTGVATGGIAAGGAALLAAGGGLYLLARRRPV